ncbi:RNA polymerase sigma factor [Algisphaera agarilytica]|uniref:RNA polymerase sigma-70 factor (ECF subfamily) n=1 Tax=Algisphaera agarilytica TaxID=1385975 RepID=A0A7X0H5F6_9BACT|nr:sigma-70 family RNA polymerase sigma factor [Algisphaera agarilytica]MBB6429478.1 RNA polymerase sigma-70 factor (ECF subfamily) [Algisphaera agarilytica]
MDTFRQLEVLSDEQLVEHANRGDAQSPAAFETLYRRHRDTVLRLARRYTRGDEALALDAAQETFIYLLGKFPPPPENQLTLTAKLTTFLFPVARHAALSATKKKARLRLTTGDALPEPIAESPIPLDDGLDALLGRLSDEHCEVVLLRFVDDMTVPEIARALDIPQGTVKSRLHHAVAQLRRDPATKKYFELP